jgi:hypothetical protein
LVGDGCWLLLLDAEAIVVLVLSLVEASAWWAVLLVLVQWCSSCWCSLRRRKGAKPLSAAQPRLCNQTSFGLLGCEAMRCAK